MCTLCCTVITIVYIRVQGYKKIYCASVSNIAMRVRLLRINRDGQGPPHRRCMGYNGQFSSLPHSCLTLITQNGRDGVGIMSCEYADFTGLCLASLDIPWVMTYYWTMSTYVLCMPLFE